MKRLILLITLLQTLASHAQLRKDTLFNSISRDTLKQRILNEVIVTASRMPESTLRSPISIDQLTSISAKNMAAPSVFDAIENCKGVQMITPSLGFKVINTRGFANTTNVRFAQLIDGIDNQAPHLGAPIANALGANDLDIDKVEIIPGTASALYGMNSINGMVNILTKNPFVYKGLSTQQLIGINHAGKIDSCSPQLYSQTNFRYANAINPHFAFKINGSYINGQDWIADNRTDLASNFNASVGLTGMDNPAFDEVNSYGNESPNRRTLTLKGKKHVVARTGYRESEIENYNLKNWKGDAGLYYRPKENHEFCLNYKGAIISTIYQRSNRFRLQDYVLHQYALDYHSSFFAVRSYLTQENTGKSYNIRSLAENMDKTFKSDEAWFTDYAIEYSNAHSQGYGVSDAHRFARNAADNGRFRPGTAAYNQKISELININNWDYGAALRVKSYLLHSEGLVNWNKLFYSFFGKYNTELLSGFDYRTYFIIPDGNYFINAIDPGKVLTISKTGGFTALNKNLLNNKIRLSVTIRADKADYFGWKFNPRLTLVYSPKEIINIRAAYQSGCRFPSIFEGFSNVNSGGVKRVGGLKIMSDGIFENSYTKASIDAFQTKVNSDVNTFGLTQIQAIDKNKGMLQKNPYTYLQPEHIRSFEFGMRGIVLNKRLFIDADVYYNTYENFIAQVEASIPSISIYDSIPSYLYSKTKQTRYRLWTNSKSKIYNHGGSLGLKYKSNEKFSFLGNVTYSKLDKIDDKDGLEDGFNTPAFIFNGTIITENIWKNMGASATYHYQTKYDYVSFLVAGEVPSYWTVDMQVNYNFKKKNLRIKLGATNVLNKPYYSILGGPSVGGLYYLSITYSLGV